jgi:hypothetical protein
MRNTVTYENSQHTHKRNISFSSSKSVPLQRVKPLGWLRMKWAGSTKHMLQTNQNSIINLWERLRDKCSNLLSDSYKLGQLTSEIQNFSYNHKQKNKNGFFSAILPYAPLSWHSSTSLMVFLNVGIKLHKKRNLLTTVPIYFITQHKLFLGKWQHSNNKW